MILKTFLIVVIFFTSGCMMANRQPRYEVPSAFEVKTFKRRTKHDTQDFVYRWTKKAYKEVDEPLRHRLSEDKQRVLERHGQPDYLRDGFTARSGEFVDEWAYWDRQIITQFVGGQLVYEGPLTDMDSYRIRYGYPRDASTQYFETGVQRDIWDYRGFVFDNDGLLVTFTNEELVTRNEY